MVDLIVVIERTTGWVCLCPVSGSFDSLVGSSQGGGMQGAREPTEESKKIREVATNRKCHTVFFRPAQKAGQFKGVL